MRYIISNTLSMKTFKKLSFNSQIKLQRKKKHKNKNHLYQQKSEWHSKRYYHLKRHPFEDYYFQIKTKENNDPEISLKIPPFSTILWNSKGGILILFLLVFLNKFFGCPKIFTFEGGILKMICPDIYIKNRKFLLRKISGTFGEVGFCNIHLQFST